MKKKLLEKDIFYLSLFICICLVALGGIIFTNKTENIFTDGFELTESYNCGYLKCIKLIIKLLSCQSEEKENVFKEINSVDLSYYYNYSCKSCFVKGFIVNELNNKGMKIIK